MIDLSDDGHVASMLAQLLRDPTLYPDEFKAWLTNWMEVSPPTLPLDQISGFSDYQIKSVTTDPEISITGGAAYVTSGGPIVSNLPPGKYLVIYSATGHGNASQRISVMVDNVTVDPDTPDCARWDSTTDQSHGSQIVVDLKKEVQMVYRSPVGGSVVYFSNRTLSVQRIST